MRSAANPDTSAPKPEAGGRHSVAAEVVFPEGEGGGGKRAMNRKTTIKLLRTDVVWQPRIGGRPGNRNAVKTGLHTAEMPALRRRIADWRRKVRAMLASLEA